MNQSFRIGSVFGITIRVHMMFLVLLALFVLPRAGTLIEGLMLSTALVAAIFLHELGHSLMAQRHGIQVIDIVFWPMGGVARMSELPQDWKVESQIAFAGPAVNFVLAALTVPFALLIGGYTVNAFLYINLILGIFNLIPAFPLDGARVLRALFARNSEWLEATQKTASIGRGIATLILFGGMAITLPFFDFFGCFWSVVLAAMTWWFSTQEVLAVQMRNMRSAFEGGEQGSPFGPFAQASGFGATQPETQEAPDIDQGSHDHGFSSKDIKDLESFRGSLRNRKRDS